MVLVIIGLIILSFGLYYVPIKEVELTVFKIKTPRWLDDRVLAVDRKVNSIR